MTPEEYSYLEATLAGRRGRDSELESKMSMKAEGKFARQAEERRQQLAARTPEERELEVRRFNLQMLGKAGMERCARPIAASPYGELSVPGDQLQGHSATIKGQLPLNGRPVPPKHLKLQFHSAAEESGCRMWKA